MTTENERVAGLTSTHETFADKVAFVTGAASGIGRTTAAAFARAGASVVVADLADEQNEQTARLIQATGGRVLAVKCDVTRSEDVKAALERAMDTFGRLDFAFNNAGVEQPVKALADITEHPRRSPQPSSGCAQTQPPSSSGTQWLSTEAKPRSGATPRPRSRTDTKAGEPAIRHSVPARRQTRDPRPLGELAGN